MACLRLSIEPIPGDSELASLAKLLPAPQWDRIRRSIYRSARYRCQVCGREGRLHCHEVWQYNEQTGCQWLSGFQALCQGCHDVKHVFFARGDARRAELLRHFMAVNRLTPEGACDYLRGAAERQQRLNQRQWTINYGDYSSQISALADRQQRSRYVRLNRPSYSRW